MSKGWHADVLMCDGLMLRRRRQLGDRDAQGKRLKQTMEKCVLHLENEGIVCKEFRLVEKIMLDEDTMEKIVLHKAGN